MLWPRSRRGPEWVGPTLRSVSADGKIEETKREHQIEDGVIRHAPHQHLYLVYLCNVLCCDVFGLVGEKRDKRVVLQLSSVSWQSTWWSVMEPRCCVTSSASSTQPTYREWSILRAGARPGPATHTHTHAYVYNYKDVVCSMLPESSEATGQTEPTLLTKIIFICFLLILWSFHGFRIDSQNKVLLFSNRLFTESQKEAA